MKKNAMYRRDEERNNYTPKVGKKTKTAPPALVWEPCKVTYIIT